MVKNYSVLIIIVGAFLVSGLSAATLKPRISVSEEYNDNIYLEKEKTDDWITFISPGFHVDAKTRRKGITLDYEFSKSLYQEHSKNNSERHKASLESWFKPFRYTEINLTDSFIQSEEPNSSVFEGDRRTVRDLYRSNTAAINLSHQFGKRRNVSAGYEHMFKENENPDIEDDQDHIFSFNIMADIITDAGIETDVSHTRKDYDFSADYDLSEGRIRLYKKQSRTFEYFLEYAHIDYNSKDQDSVGDYRVYNPSIGTRIDFDNDSMLLVNIGYLVFDRARQENDTTMSFTGNGIKKWKFKKGDIQIFGESDYSESQLNSQSMGLTFSWKGGGSAQWNPYKTVSVNIHSDYEEIDYRHPPVGREERKDKTVNAGFRMTWRPMEKILTSLTYNYSELNSDDKANDYEENSAILSVTLTPDSIW